MAIVVFGLGVIFVFIQFIKLSTVGRLGVRISALESEQKTIALENELLKSEINELKSPARIESILGELGEFHPTQIKIIDEVPQKVIAQNR